jgi:flagellar hook-length control protein FliK
MNLASLGAMQAAATHVMVEPTQQASHGPDTEKATQEQADRDKKFEAALRQALKKPATEPVNLPMSWLQLQQDALEDDANAQAITEAGAASATGHAPPRWSAADFLGGTQPTAVPLKPLSEPGAAKKPENSQEVHILLEPGLPPIQPASLRPDEAVSLVNFPQVVVGQVQQMVKNQQPVTQLDFQITPPNVGPVNLQITLENGAVNVQLAALTIQAKQALESQVGLIQSILTSHNLAPGEIKVVTASAGKQGAQGAGHKGEQPAFAFGTGGRKRGNGKDLTINT